MEITNIQISFVKANHCVVIGDTKRFGKQEILFEGSSRRECLSYIVAHIGRNAVLATINHEGGMKRSNTMLV